MSDDLLRRARAVLDAATSCPWQAEGRDDATHRGMTVLTDGADQIVGTVCGNDPYEHQFAESDVDAIVLSRNAIAALLDVLTVAQLWKRYPCDCNRYAGICRGCRTRNVCDEALATLRTELERVGAK